MSSSLAISAPVRAEHQPILSSEALEFVSALVERFGPRVSQLLQAREERQRRLQCAADSGRATWRSAGHKTPPSLAACTAQIIFAMMTALSSCLAHFCAYSGTYA